MSSTSMDTLVRMANQIADFFKIQSADQAVAGTADHMRKFWDPRMRAMMTQHLAHGGAGLNPIALKATQQVCKPAAQSAAGGHS
ncbi:MAG TPA: formate dehydrogenase subunit delta [Micropepsaceae bacterium]|nr:formate dehydrogenase subunit delta [Micropepsaceae bacterium]